MRTGDDYAQIDLTLTRTPANNPAIPEPAPGLGYSGFSPEQRAAFLAWTLQPAMPACAAFQQLYLANLEVQLLEDGALPYAVRAELFRLATAPAWRFHHGLSRTLLLACWLVRDGAACVSWLEQSTASPEIWEPALGCQLLLGAALQFSQVQPLIIAWDLPSTTLPASALRLRFDSLINALGQEPLAYIAAQLDDQARLPKPWRCQHRDLRLAIPQPPVQPLLEPLLLDMLIVTDAAVAASEAAALDAAVAAADNAELDADLSRAHLILEFGQSRSEVFTLVLRQAQRQTGFQQIMDEDRRMIYRVPYRRNELRRFWQMWDYVQGWSTTRVYCNGQLLEKWQIYPYSQYMR